MEKYGSFTVRQLKIELSKRGAKLSGKKEDLIHRLDAYDRNNNFVPEDVVPDESEEIDWPSDSHFKSVSHNFYLPRFSIPNILDHLSDSSSMDKAVHRKSYAMMEQNFVRAVVEAERGDFYFYKAQVNSEYQKSMTYFVKVTIDKENGNVRTSNCECVAGTGTRTVCKHVGAFCYALLRFVDRREWPIKKTCTEIAQKWRLPKKQKIQESPLKSEALSYHVPDFMKNEKKKVLNHIYDPRPPEMRNKPNYPDYARNLIINFSINQGITLGINGIIGGCNREALKQDHDYLDHDVPYVEDVLPNEDDLQQKLTEKIMEMASKADEIEQRTRLQSASDEWIRKRQFFVTASNVGTIIHATDRRCMEKLAISLVDPPKIKSKAIEWGKIHEKTALAEFEKRSLIKVQQCGSFISKTHPYIAGSPDGLVCELTVLEIKCPYSIRDTLISEKKLKYLEAKDGELQLKKTSNYYYQVQTQMFVAGRQFADFVIWTKKDFKRLSVTRDDNVIFNEILPKVHEFHKMYLVPALVKKHYLSR